MKASRYNLELPMGHLSFFEDGDVAVKILTNLRNKEKMRAAVMSLSNLDSYRFWVCSSSEQESHNLNLSYSKPSSEVISLQDLIPLWRATAGLYLSQVLGLARSVFRAAGELENLHPFRFLISPEQVFYVKDKSSGNRWITLPLPIDEVSIADFLRANETCWKWFSADELLSVANVDRSYRVGAILYLCLIGELFPKEISRNERIRRILLYRAGNSALAGNTLRNAMPHSLASKADELCDFIMTLLGPDFGRSLTTAQVSRRLDGFYEELSPYRLACHWEDENDNVRALKNIEYFISTVSEQELNSDIWNLLERLRRKNGDFAGADAARKRYAEPVSLRDSLHELLGSGDDQKLAGQIISDWDRVESLNNSEDERDYLYLAYINGRNLKQTDETLSRLERDFSISWFKVVRFMLISRLSADKMNWVQVIQNCRKGRKIVSKMPDTGGKIGRYADAYFYLIEGIASIYAISGQRHLQNFLNDAFHYLSNAWLNQKRAETEDLDKAIIGWLYHLNEIAGNNQSLKTLRLGIEVFLQMLDTGKGEKKSAKLPEIPWFDEAQVFF